MLSNRFQIETHTLPPLPEESSHAYHQRLQTEAHTLAHGMLPAGDWIKGIHGKPALADGSAHFNLTHCDGLVACAIGPFACGVDAEPLSRSIGAALRKVCSPLEQAFVRAYGTIGFFRLWTLKESFVKCTGDGLSYPLREACFIPLEDTLTFCNDGFFFQQWITSTHVLSFCTKCPGIPARPVVATLLDPFKIREQIEIVIGKD